MIYAACVLAGACGGAILGVIVTALCVAAGREDRRREQTQDNMRKETDDHGKSGF